MIVRPRASSRRRSLTWTPTASATRCPLRYETRRRPEREVWLTRHLLPDYQGTTVWTSLGAMYLQVLRTVDPVLASTETARYVEWIERDGTYWEVMDHRGQNWVSPPGS